MDKSWMNIVHRTTDQRFELGVNEFLKFAYRDKDESSQIPCPCKTCNNFRHHSKTTVFSHLMQKGISTSYDQWIYHGEAYSGSDDSDDYISHDESNGANDDMNDDDLDEMLDNIGQSAYGDNWQTSGESSCTLDKDLETLHRLVDESHQELYTGCQNYSKFSFIITLLHLKTTSGWSIKSFEALLDIFRKALPTPAAIPKNFYEAKKYIRDLGFGGEKIDACVNDCILYRKEYKYHTQCPNDKCKEPRFSGSDSKVPRKVLRYFPLKPRLQRLFIDKQVSCDMRWHKEKRVNDDNIVRHPADSEAWKHLDRIFPSFAQDPRNIRLGLAADGFNPFGNLSSSYSIWPVFIVPYNLPPWKCMKDPYMFMSMLIPGPKSPGINIDTYLQPLIDELNELWVGVNAYDAHSEENFTLRAALLWTINDFPAYGMLSGWSVKGYKACPVCMNETSSHYLNHSRKICYMGHRRFLPVSHKWRMDKKNFDGKMEIREAVKPLSGDKVLQDIDCAISDPNRFVNTRKRKYSEYKQGWKKKSVFHRLPYFCKLLLRHHIDIMHVVKNITESLIATLFDIKGKTKDTWNSRKDLKDHKLKKKLHLQRDGDTFIMPMACYHFTKDEKQKILNFLESLKFPDRFASNISRCIKEGEFQISRMKSHDFYIFIQHVLPLSIRGFLTKEVRLMLYELSDFIKTLCSRNMYLDVLEKQEAQIAIILCKMERIFPQSFFDIMTHLLIHLPYEAKIAGSPQYRWMFPFERKMGILKGYVKNKARPEGCIAERYIDKECLTFCSMYLNDVDTIFNKAERNNEMADSGGQISVFSCKGRPLGGPKKYLMNETELEKIHTYIINNCHEMEVLINEHKTELEEENSNEVNERHDKQFASWLQQRVDTCLHSFSSEIRILSRGPLDYVSRYSGCMVNGYRFHTQSREENRKTQNSGVVVEGDHETNLIEFYGILKEVLELEYLGENKRVILFKCDWFKVSDGNGLQIDKESAVTSVNTSRKWYINQPYILASQAKQVFYVPDLKLGKSWYVVQKVTPRTLYDIPIEEVHQEEPNSTISGVSTRRSTQNLPMVDDEFTDDDAVDPTDATLSETSQDDYTDSE